MQFVHILQQVEAAHAINIILEMELLVVVQETMYEMVPVIHYVCKTMEVV